MRYTLTTGEIEKEEADCFVVGVFKNKVLSKSAARLDRMTAGYITQILASGDLTETLGNALLLYNVPHLLSPRVMLVYCGDIQALDVVGFRKLSVSVALRLNAMSLTRIVDTLCYDVAQALDCLATIRQSIETTEDCLYHFEQFKTQTTGRSLGCEAAEFIFKLDCSIDMATAEKVVLQAIAISQGVKYTKDLANLPANICTPSYVAEQAKKLALEKNLSMTVLDQAALLKEKMHSFLAVAQGSQEPPQFVVLEYQGLAQKNKPIVLIGKGVTFDSGGICLKPAVGMEEMKFDMAGAASVLGTLHAIATLKLPVNVIGVMPLTENMPSGHAMKPGDIVTSLSGQTVEIINTDAEGRLILADALTYSERFSPEIVIDVATLTGAVIIALGSVASGLMSNDVLLTKELEQAGLDSTDRVWSLPLWDDYQEQINSQVADMANVGVGGAKSITAACFLARFTKKFRWAHLDIAGTAWKSGKEKMATGRPVSLLVQFLLNRCLALCDKAKS